jgi:RNA polymerase-binding transcription factor DksA
MSTLAAPTQLITARDQLPEKQRVVLEEQWRRQVADIVNLSYNALTLADDADRSDGDGSRANELHVTSQLLAAARQQLVESEFALARLDDGTYGLCADCASPISPERLEILPAARHCVACQASRNLRG